MIYRPDFKKAEQEAQQILIGLHISKLPVKVKKIARYFDNLKIKKYSWYAKKYNCSIEEVCNLTGSDEGCCWYFKKTNQYLILYNDLVANKGRIRWTIAHELGHFILKHNEMSDKAILARSSITSREYEVFETEANCFARELLAPPPIIRAINWSGVEFLSNLCEISYEASNNVINFIKTGARMGRNYKSPLNRTFSNFIFKVKHSTYCRNCHHTFSTSSAKFCPICKSESLLTGPEYFKEEITMRYEKIQLNEAGRATKCPVCQNENIKGKYCSVCKSYLFNKCTGLDDRDPSCQDHDIPFWHQHDGGCGEILEGDARYCHECGSTSTFYEDKILQYWGRYQTNQGLELVVKEEELPF